MVRGVATFSGRLRDLNSHAERLGLAFRLKATREPDAPVDYRSVDFGGIRFEYWRQDASATFTEPARAECHHFVFPIRSSGRLRVGRRECTAEAKRHAFALSPNRAHETVQASGWRDFSVAISAAALRRQWDSLGPARSHDPIEFPSLLDLSTRTGARVRRLVEFMSRETLREDGLMHVPASRARLVETLQAVLLTQLPHTHHGLLPSVSKDRGARVVGAAEEFMAEHLGQPVRMTEVAAIAGVSLRALQEAFRRHRGHGPLEFLKRRRLERARASLRTDPGARVTSIALDCGFAHASHFGAAYKRLFDETPSETRRSARIR